MTGPSKAIPFNIPPVVKTVDYAGTPDQAFARFAGQIGAWWPLATNSLAKRIVGVTVSFDRLEPGGRLVERWSTGEAHVWGTITEIDRPARLAFTWHVGRSKDEAQRVEITFTAAGPQRTIVQLVHSGWESLARSATETRNAYDQGWDPVLHLYASGGPA